MIDTLSAITTVFIALKLAGVIDWTWLQVLSPMLFCLGIAFLLAVVQVILEDAGYYR